MKWITKQIVILTNSGVHFYSSFHKSNIFVTVFLNKQIKKKSMKENEQKKNQFNIDGIINGNVFYFPDQWLNNQKKKQETLRNHDNT